MLYELGVVDADRALLETDESSTFNSTKSGNGSSLKGGMQVDISLSLIHISEPTRPY